MATQDFERKLTAILSADVKGYSRLMREDEEATVRTITAYREVIGSGVQKNRGRVVDSPGDNILCEFASVVDAVRSAVEIQEELKNRNAELPEERRMEFRIGINLGDVIHAEERIYGDGVNVAARLESLAESGGICISRSAYDQVKNKLTLGYEYLGEHSVKNIDELVRVYRVLTEPELAGKVIGEKKVDRQPRVRAAILAMVTLLLVAGAVFFWKSKIRPPSPSAEVASVKKLPLPLTDKPSIDVLPSNDPSGDSYQEYLIQQERKREEERRLLAEKRESLIKEEERIKADKKLYQERMQHLELERKRLEEARAKEEERKFLAEKRESLIKEEERAKADKKLYQERMQHLELEKERLEEARAKVEHELLEKEKTKFALVPKTVTSTKVSLRTEPKLILDSYMRTTLGKHGFFDARLNPQGSFDNHFVDNGDGTVTDRSTGLMWQKSGSSSMRTRDKAQGYVSKLNETLFAKYWDWRIPTIDELASLLEENQKNGLHIDPLFNEEQKRCWSSDIRDDSVYRKEVWIVDFVTGRLTAAYIASQGTDASQFESNYVRAVRSTK